MLLTRQHFQEATQVIRQQMIIQPHIGLILSSGLGLPHHSDLAAYASETYQHKLATAKSIVSRGRNCLDNAPMESFWLPLKCECAATVFASPAHTSATIRPSLISASLILNASARETHILH